MDELAAQAEWQASEEARHEGAASLTAVRIWPLVAHVVVGQPERARRRFIRIITAYKIWVWREATAPTHKVVLTIRPLVRHMRTRTQNWAAFQSTIDELVEEPVGRSVFVQYYQLLRRREQGPTHATIAGHKNPKLLKAVANELRRRIYAASKSRRLGRRERPARRFLLLALMAWWNREVDAERGLARSGDRFSSDFIDILCAINRGLHAEIRRTNVHPMPKARWLPPTLPLGPVDETSGRRRIIAALADLN
jgi:hypothetical protein